MKTQPINKSLSLKLFSEAEEIKDLVGIINYGKSLANNEAKDIKVKTVVFHANHSKNEHRYTKFEVKKKSGGVRTIHAPNKGLKGILQGLNEVILNLYDFHEASFGFVPNKSIVENAKLHTGHRFVYNIDLKDFFHSFDRKWVKYGFMMPPFNLNGEKENLAFFLASLCTHPFEVDGDIKHVLPQGAPTSPTITNILCRRLDRKLTGFAKRFGVTYSRYADDITFSSNHDVYKKEDFQKELKRIIEDDQKLKINPKKTRLQNENYRQEVTGLVVNEKVNVTRRYVKQIRQWLYLWERYGYKKASEIILKDHISDKGHVKNHTTPIEAILGGKLEFLKSVVGEKSTTYLVLSKRFSKLDLKNYKLNSLLNLWEKEGVENARTYYFKNKSFGNFSDSLIKTYYKAKRFVDMPENPSQLAEGIYSVLHKKMKVYSSINKYDFVTKVLKNEKFNSIQKDRLNQLLFKELGEKAELDSVIIDRIKELENKFENLNSSPRTEPQKTPKNLEEQNDLKPKKLPRPKELADFLEFFASKEGSIKNLTHTFNYDVPNYEEFMERCKSDFKEGVEKYQNVPDAILTRIRNFAFESNPKWYLRKKGKKQYYEEGWSKPNFIEWFKKSKKHPADNNYQNLSMIKPFKESIQIRADIGNLKRIIRDAFDAVFKNERIFNLEISDNINSAQFYTDVDRLEQAIFHIFKLIKSYGENNLETGIKIEYSINEETGFKELSIIHINSEATKSAKDKNFKGGDFDTIFRILYGICNWEIKAKFTNGYFQFPLLTDKKPTGAWNENIAKENGNGNFKVLAENDINGFTHIFQFY